MPVGVRPNCSRAVAPGLGVCSLNVEDAYAYASEHRASSSAPLSHSMIATPT